MKRIEDTSVDVFVTILRWDSIRVIRTMIREGCEDSDPIHVLDLNSDAVEKIVMAESFDWLVAADVFSEKNLLEKVPERQQSNSVSNRF
ncbi:unnamed protein product [Microthlaspi erraticum]|uniref:Uncharacterized protein n=1 Tax=Microthlaspi erraticum TaxID=1685480 RepID=A0A6D2KKR6_9BRAS|nr:unnamed protein product [Microthlaspi erraticum]